MEIEFFDSRDLARQASTPETIPEASPLQNTTDINEPPRVLTTPEDEETYRELSQMQLMLDDPVAYESAVIDEQAERLGKLSGED